MNLPNVPEFPVNSLPEPIRDYVRRYAEVLAVPAGMIATPLLVAAGSTLGNAARIQIKRGFVQNGALFAAVVSPPGKTKSPAQDVALAPLWALQKAAEQKHEEQKAAWKIKAAAEKAAKRPIPDEPTLESVITTDATLEAIVAMLKTGPGFLMARDEISGFVSSFNQYRGGNGADRENWLSIWAGTFIKVDRKGGDPIIVEKPVVGVVGGIQPDMLANLLTFVDRDGGVLRDGFIERFLLDYPDTKPTRWNNNEADPLLDIETYSVFAQLRNRPGGNPPTPITAHLSTEALSLWIAWFNDNGEQTDAAYGLRAGFFSKLPLQLARITLVLHALTDPDNLGRDVSPETMAAGIELVEYYRANAIRTISHYKEGATTDPLDKKIRTLLDAAGGSWLTRTELYNNLSRNYTRDEIGKVLETLKAEGFAETKSEQTNGRSVESWRRVITNPERDNAKYAKRPYTRDEPIDLTMAWEARNCRQQAEIDAMREARAWAEEEAENEAQAATQ